MEISKEKFKKLGVSALIAAVGAAALFQLGSVVNDKVYDINAEQYFSEQTVKYGSVTDFKIESLIRTIDKKVASEAQWDKMTSEAYSDVKKIKELIKSDDFRQMVQNDDFYRSAESAVNFGLGWDLTSYTFNNDGKKVDAFNNFKENTIAHYAKFAKYGNELATETLNQDDKVFTGKVDLSKVQNAHDDELFAANAKAEPIDPLEFAKVKNRIEQIRDKNAEQTKIDTKVSVTPNKLKPS